MARWEPGAAERLTEAAYSLFDECGFDGTTVADIAARAGLTERTFFRHFADKREVLFAGGAILEERLAAAVREATPGTPPFTVVVDALAAIAEQLFEHRRAAVERRQRLIDGHPELQERERAKMASLAASVAAGLRARGVAEPNATLAAASGSNVLQIAFARWLADEAVPLADQVRSCAATLATVVADDPSTG